MPVGSVLQNIENILRRIEEIQKRFGAGPQACRSFEQSLREAQAGTAPASAGTGSEAAPARTAGSGASGGGAGASAAAGRVGATANPDAAGNGAQGELDGIIAKAAERFRIPETLIRAVIKQESGFDRSAVSSKGAMGLMQLMPRTAALLGVSDPFDPVQNVMGGTRYLRTLLQQFGGNLNQALAAYNAGPHNVQGSVPEFPETVDFVDAVLRNFEELSSQGE